MDVCMTTGKMAKIRTTIGKVHATKRRLQDGGRMQYSQYIHRITALPQITTVIYFNHEIILYGSILFIDRNK